jgi:ATP/maltotriose-dependent transcriptional regulator MalT
MLNLIATKLRHLVVPPKRVKRPYLLRWLTEGLSAGHLLTLVSAPPGFGKTMCVTDAASALDVPAAWCGLIPLSAQYKMPDSTSGILY